MADKVGFLETVGNDGTVSKSSKRLIGVIAFGLGSAMLAGLGIASFFVRAADPGTVQTVGIALISTGAGLLGIGVLEGITKR